MNSLKLSHLFLNTGAVLEYYDYLIFIFLAKILTQVFFPNLDQGNVTINFLFFALGSAVKIIGGLGFGYLSDIFGPRKIILCMSILMAFSTIAMGLMPYGLDMKFYVFLFFVLRIVQALSFGGEIPCATTFAYELEEDDQKKNSRISHIFSAAAVGSIIATSVLSFLTFSLDMNQVQTWGWRVPFLVGGALGILSFFLRKNLPETFLPNLEKNNLREIFIQSKSHLKDIIPLPFVLLFPATLITVNLYFPIYVSQHFEFSLDKIYFAQTISLIFSACLAIVAGMVSDKKLIRKLYLGMLIGFMCVCPFLVSFLKTSLVGFMILWQFFITPSIVFGMFLILNILPISIRAKMNGIIYNLTFFAVSFVPIVFEKMLNVMPNPVALFYGLLFISIVSFVSVLRTK